MTAKEQLQLFPSEYVGELDYSMGQVHFKNSITAFDDSGIVHLPWIQLTQSEVTCIKNAGFQPGKRYPLNEFLSALRRCALNALVAPADDN